MQPITATIALPTAPTATIMQMTTQETIRIPANFDIAFFVVIAAILLAIMLVFRKYAAITQEPVD